MTKEAYGVPVPREMGGGKQEDMGASASRPGSREPGLASRPGPAGFDPSRKRLWRAISSEVWEMGFLLIAIGGAFYQRLDISALAYGLSLNVRVTRLERNRDSDGSPKGEDALAASSETTARAGTASPTLPRETPDA